MVRRKRSVGRRKGPAASAPGAPGAVTAATAAGAFAAASPGGGPGAAPGGEAGAAAPGAPYAGGERLAAARAFLRRLCNVFGLPLTEQGFLQQALTHPSFAHERQMPAAESNQRLEFLGDSVVGLVVCDALFLRYGELAEGELSRLKAALVSETSLAEAARRIGLGDFLLLDRGEEAGGGRTKSSVLADGFEAVVAATFLEGGLAAARSLLTVSLLGPALEAAGRGEFLRDYKSSLQERVQREPGTRLSYRVEEERGPDHDKLFCVGVYLDGRLLGRGLGRCKRDAEQEAAQAALETLEGLSGRLEAAAFAEGRRRPAAAGQAVAEGTRPKRPRATRRRSARRGRGGRAPRPMSTSGSPAGAAAAAPGRSSAAPAKPGAVAAGSAAENPGPGRGPAQA